MSAILDVPIQAIQGLLAYFPKKEIEQQTVLVKEVIEKMSLPAQGFVRLAGLSGGIAIAMAGYGSHAFQRKTDDEKRKAVGSMMTAGMTIFCGTCYYSALTGDSRIRWLTPYGGMLLILSWFAMIL